MLFSLARGNTNGNAQPVRHSGNLLNSSNCRVGRVMLSDHCCHPGGGPNDTGPTFFSTKAVKIAHGSERNGSSDMCGSHGRTQRNCGHNAGSDPMYPEYSVRTRTGGWNGAAFFCFIKYAWATFIGGTKTATNQPVCDQSATHQRTKRAKWRSPSLNSSNRFLNGPADPVLNWVKRFKTILFALVCTGLLPLGAANAAASLVVGPTRVVFTDGTPVVAVTVTNQGSSEAVIQLQLMAWSQSDGADVYVPIDSNDIIACPSIFTVPPGQSQVVRVGLEEKRRDWSIEGAYRLFINEIPPEPTPGATAVQVAVRISVPVFLTPTQVTQPPINWQIESREGDGLWMTIHNNGNVHALVNRLRLMADEQIFFETATHQYILPDASVSWRIDTNDPITGSIPEVVDLMVATDQGVYEKTLTIGR